MVRELQGQHDLLQLCERWPDRYPFLLESVVHGTDQARFDLLFACPESVLTLDAAGVVMRDGELQDQADFLAVLDRWWEQERQPTSETPLPFAGGWFLYLGYELAGQVEPTLDLPRPGGDFPVAFAVRCPAAIIRDHGQGVVQAVCEPGRESLLQQLAEDWEEAGAAEPESAHAPLRVVEENPEQFRRALDAIHEYILAGDVFQVNISRKWKVEAPLSPIGAYRGLRQHNPAPFAALARWEDAAVVSSSPERLLQAGDGWVQTRPIAGTRPRGTEGVGDAMQKDELIQHPKERAEHIMLIDLERNDLGRVCEPGSVEVDELMVVESYAHVHHIVSNVRGRLRPEVRPGEIIRAVFPGGTITGCPKVRCMEIIAELEGEGRGPYTGSLGYLNRDGSMDLNILIRTLLIEPHGASFRAGAGIVADSETERELEETRSKAKGLLLALQPESEA